MSLNFPPAQSSFGLSFGKASSDAGGRAAYFATSLHQVSCVTVVWFPGRTRILCILHGKMLVAIGLETLEKKKINTLDHYLTPYRPLLAVCPACSDYTRSLLTTQLA